MENVYMGENFIEFLERIFAHPLDEDIKNLANDLDNYRIEYDMVYNHNYFEKIYSLKIGRYRRYNHFNGEKIEDKSNNLIYRFESPSPTYILKSLHSFFINGEANSIIDSVIFPFALEKNSDSKNKEKVENVLKDRYRNGFNRVKNVRGGDRARQLRDLDNITDEPVPVCEVSEIFYRILNLSSLIITSEKNKEKFEFEKLSDSFTFSVGYNLSIPIIDFTSKYKEIVPTRLDYNDIQAPQRTYDKNLLQYYQQALSSDNSTIKFLSYYNCLEYFFRKVADEKIRTDIKLKILNPSFNINDEKSVDKIINCFDEYESQDNEKDHLKLVLNKFIDKKELLNDLKNCGNDCDKILNKKVNFANADQVNDGKNFNNHLANRIYDIRNALVHSKEGLSNSFIPFKKSHERELKDELIVIRLVAEQIIRGNSEPI